MARKKKDEEEDLPLYLWLRAYTKKLVPPRAMMGIPIPKLERARVKKKTSTSKDKRNTVPPFIPYSANPYILRQLFNIPAYIIYGTLLPTPLEQIAFAKDPLGIVPPYEWKGGMHNCNRLMRRSLVVLTQTIGHRKKVKPLLRCS